MHTLPDAIVSILRAFATSFTKPTFESMRVLIVGAILTVGRRTVASVLRTMGLGGETHFQNYHRVLNRAKWSGRRCSEILLSLLVGMFVPEGPVVVGGDETLERRQGHKIKKLGVYRDAARSSRNFFVKSTGLRWVCLMLLAPIPWAKRIWALPFLSVLAPSERYNQEHHKRHKTITDWMRQMLAAVRCWLPDREIIFVGDRSYATLELLNACVHNRITAITRLRLDAALYQPLPTVEAGKCKAGKCKAGKRGRGRPRLKGARLPNLESVSTDPDTVWTKVTVRHWYANTSREIEICTGTAVWYGPGKPAVPIRWVLIRDPQGKATKQGRVVFQTQALLSTDLSMDALRIIELFVQRWQLESTFQEVRTHLGVETQRQWNDLAIDRTTPLLLGLFSLVTLLAQSLLGERSHSHHDERGTDERGTDEREDAEPKVRTAAWYSKTLPTFSDTLAFVRRSLWQWRIMAEENGRMTEKKGSENICVSGCKANTQIIDNGIWRTLTDLLVYAA